LVALSRHALANHLAGGHVECREQRGGAMAFVIMCHGASAAMSGRLGLRAIERLTYMGWFLVKRYLSAMVMFLECRSGA
jgi:hypothetical protein